MKSAINFALLSILVCLLLACNKKHKYKYVEYYPREFIGLVGEEKMRAQKEIIFYEANDSIACLKAYELHMIGWAAYKYFNIDIDYIKYQLYDSKGWGIENNIHFENEEKLQEQLRAKYRADTIILQFLDSQTRQELRTIAQALTHPPGYHRINAFGCIRLDSSHFVQLKSGLYLNKDGVLGFLSEDGSDYGRPVDIYLTTVYYADLSDTINGGLKEMRYVVDTASFEMLSFFYCKDKRYIYDFNPMMDGGTLAINRDADIKTFGLLESEYYAKDKRYCYYRGNIIEGADRKTFRMLDTAFSKRVACDKNGYYSSGDKMSKKDVLEQNLDSVRRQKDGR